MPATGVSRPASGRQAPDPPQQQLEPSLLTSGTAGKLERAQEALVALHSRVKSGFLIIGSLLTIGGVLLWVIAESRVAEWLTGPFPLLQPLSAAISLGGFPCFALTVVPSDKHALHTALRYVQQLSGFIGALFCAIAANVSGTLALEPSPSSGRHVTAERAARGRR